MATGRDAREHDPRRARRPESGIVLRRSSDDRVVAGVCGGIAALTGAKPRTVRIIYALSALPSFGATLFGYLLLWLLIPAAPAAGMQAAGAAKVFEQ